MAPPKTLPADFFDKQGSGAPNRLPANFFDAQSDTSDLPPLRRPSVPPLPEPSAPPQKDYLSRFIDEISAGMESTAQLPTQVMGRARELYKQGQAKGGIPGGIQMLTSPFRAEGDALRGLLESVFGVTTPGLIQRVIAKEDPAKIAADMTTFLVGWMGAGPEGESAAKLSPEQAARKITDAVNPIPTKMEQFQTSVAQHIDKIVTFAKANNIDITSLDGLGQAMKGSGDWIRQHYYNDMLAPVKDRPVSVTAIKGYSGDTATPSTATLGQLDARLTQINAELNPKYAKGGIAAQAAVKSAGDLNAEAAG